ncbi:FkbM family methyltransferase [Falsiroseomonas sp.]|uniref:FkbM family methyltransferase n=1 Tax=Falsiroseomonas sp. TaxID=2870721 RepID=UPI003F6F8AEF
MKQGIDAVLALTDRKERFAALLALLEPGDIVVDCGANIGSVAARFAARGCVMHCFEPDPLAFGMLKDRLADNASVTLHNKAVWTEAGTAKLFFHETRDEASVERTQSSSLLADKINVDGSGGHDVELVDFPAFLRALPAPAAVLKIDIEGAEGELLKEILDQNLEDRFSVCLVETHERKVPSSREPMKHVRNVIAERKLNHIFLDWK